jgi:RNA polymerase sigma-70 factor, ECF subfamily
MTTLAAHAQSLFVTDERAPAETPAAAAATARAPAPTLRQIFLSESSYVWNTLRRLGVRAQDLEDLTHEVFLAVHKRLGDYDPSRPLRPWLFGVAFRVTANYQRLARHRERVADDATFDTLDETPGAEEQLATRQAQDLVLDALAALDLKLKTVFVMHDLDGCPMPEIAAALGLPVNTAYSRLRAARAEFAAAVHRIRLRRGDR